MTYQVFDTNVPDDVFASAKPVSTAEFAVAIRALGVALAAFIPILDAMELVAKITPNPRMRGILIRARREFREGVNLSKAFKSVARKKDEVNLAFCAACDYGECTGNVDRMFLMYAEDYHVRSHALANQICRNRQVQNFIVTMAERLEHQAFLEIIDGLHSQDEFGNVLSQIQKHIEEGGYIKDALAQHPDWFDPFCLAIVEAAENAGPVELAFQLLAEA